MEYVSLYFTSRNKDNRNLEGFKPRTKIFLIDPDKMSKAEEAFDVFANEGLPGEMSRMYVYVNKRSHEKTYLKFFHYLLDHPDFDLSNPMPKLTSLASQTECAAEHKWLFDYDDDVDLLPEFLEDLKTNGYTDKVTVYPSPHGFSVVVEHGFDTRKLLEKWTDVSLNRDASYNYKWTTKPKY